MQRCAATKGDHGAGRNITPQFNGMHTGGVGHVFIDDFSHTSGRPEIFQTQFVADVLLKRGFCGIGVQCYFTACKKRRINFAQHHIGISNSRFRAATSVTYGAGVGACAVWPDSDALEFVDAGNGAAACADFHHFNNGNADGNT